MKWQALFCAEVVIKGQYVSRSDLALAAERMAGAVVWEGRALQLDGVRVGGDLGYAE